MNPLLKWAGSKRWHVESIRKHVPADARVVELFCGSAAVTFGLVPLRAVLNDANAHLMNFYHHVRAGLQFTIDAPQSEAAFYEYREWFNAIRDTNSSEAAQLFYYLNHTGFNGLCRYNKSGEFNVPYRPGRHAPAFDPYEYQRVLELWQLSCGSYRDVVLESNDFIYADPPYDGTFGGYTGEKFTWEDQQDLALLLINHPGRVVLMNANTPRIVEYYQLLGYHVQYLPSSQRMQNSRGRNDVVLEVMATNFEVV